MQQNKFCRLTQALFLIATLTLATAPSEAQSKNPRKRSETATTQKTLKTKSQSKTATETTTESATESATESVMEAPEVREPVKEPVTDSNEIQPPPSTEPAPSVDPGPVTAAQRRLANPVAVAYTGTLTSIPLPFKHGPMLAWSPEPDWTIEAAFFQGSFGFSTPWIDLGSFDEALVTLNARYFTGSSFNWIVGLSRQSYDAHLGSAMLSRISGAQADFDLIKVATLGIQLGLGNRWQMSNGLVIGVDWALFNIPFATLKSDAPALASITNQDDRDRVEDALRFMSDLPSATVLKVTVGYAF